MSMADVGSGGLVRYCTSCGADLLDGACTGCGGHGDDSVDGDPAGRGVQGAATYTGTITQVDAPDDLALIRTPEPFPALTSSG